MVYLFEFKTCHLDLVMTICVANVQLLDKVVFVCLFVCFFFVFCFVFLLVVLFLLIRVQLEESF